MADAGKEAVVTAARAQNNQIRVGGDRRSRLKDGLLNDPAQSRRNECVTKTADVPLGAGTADGSRVDAKAEPRVHIHHNRFGRIETRTPVDSARAMSRIKDKVKARIAKSRIGSEIGQIHHQARSIGSHRLSDRIGRSSAGKTSRSERAHPTHMHGTTRKMRTKSGKRSGGRP